MAAAVVEDAAETTTVFLPALQKHLALHPRKGGNQARYPPTRHVAQAPGLGTIIDSPPPILPLLLMTSASAWGRVTISCLNFHLFKRLWCLHTLKEKMPSQKIF
jgi:hypothetical protein